MKKNVATGLAIILTLLMAIMIGISPYSVQAEDEQLLLEDEKDIEDKVNEIKEDGNNGQGIEEIDSTIEDEELDEDMQEQDDEQIGDTKENLDDEEISNGDGSSEDTEDGSDNNDEEAEEEESDDNDEETGEEALDDNNNEAGEESVDDNNEATEEESTNEDIVEDKDIPDKDDPVHIVGFPSAFKTVPEGADKVRLRIKLDPTEPPLVGPANVQMMVHSVSHAHGDHYTIEDIIPDEVSDDKMIIKFKVTLTGEKYQLLTINLKDAGIEIPGTLTLTMIEGNQVTIDKHTSKCTITINDLPLDEPPIMQLYKDKDKNILGDNEQSVFFRFHDYEEYGATAFDQKDGYLEPEIFNILAPDAILPNYGIYIANNNYIPGKYTVGYRVTDSGNNTVVEKRNVVFSIPYKLYIYVDKMIKTGEKEAKIYWAYENVGVESVQADDNFSYVITIENLIRNGMFDEGIDDQFKDKTLQESINLLKDMFEAPHAGQTFTPTNDVKLAIQSTTTIREITDAYLKELFREAAYKFNISEEKFEERYMDALAKESLKKVVNDIEEILRIDDDKEETTLNLKGFAIYILSGRVEDGYFIDNDELSGGDAIKFPFGDGYVNGSVAIADISHAQAPPPPPPPNPDPPPVTLQPDPPYEKPKAPEGELLNYRGKGHRPISEGILDYQDEITIPYDQAFIKKHDAYTPIVYHYNRQHKEWAPLPTRINDNGTLTGINNRKYIGWFRAFGTKGQPTFIEDLNDEEWQVVSLINEIGLIEGYQTTDNKFVRKLKPYDPITREEYITILYRLINMDLENTVIKSMEHYAAYEILKVWYEDVDDIQYWAYEPLATFTTRGIFQGRGNYAMATEDITRLEAAMMIRRFITTFDYLSNIEWDNVLEEENIPDWAKSGLIEDEEGIEDLANSDDFVSRMDVLYVIHYMIHNMGW